MGHGFLREWHVRMLMHQADGDRALAHGGGDPLYRPVPDVADGEHTGHAGLQQQRSPWLPQYLAVSGPVSR